MKDVSVEIKVGTVVIIALVVLIYSIIWVKDYKFNVQHYEYSCLFPQIGTLTMGDPVNVLGVEKGMVKTIDISGNAVLVGFSLQSDVKLNEDARFEVMNTGLMGERFVAIWPGESNIPFDRARPGYGKYDSGIPEVMGMMGDAVDALKRLIYDIEGIVGSPGRGVQIKEVIDRLANVTGMLEELMTNNRGDLQKSIKDFSYTTGKMRQFVDSNSTSMQKVVDNLAETSGKASVTMARLDSLSAELHSISAELNRGKGTIGKALSDDSLYFDLRRTVSNLDSLVTDFKAHPKKYIHVSVF